MTHPSLTLKQTSLGLGVFTKKTIKPKDILLEFQGPQLHQTQIPTILAPQDDRYIQISPTHYLGPSNQFDDFVNHSCEPNCGVQFEKNKVVLVAIKPIKKNEEISWDYSTTMSEDDWEMKCQCGKPTCRRIIRDFKHLPQDTKQTYLNLKIVPPFVLQTPPPLLIVDLQPAFNPPPSLIHKIQKKQRKHPSFTKHNLNS